MKLKEIIIKVSFIFCITVGLLFILLDTSGADGNKHPRILEIVSFNINKSTSNKELIYTSNTVTKDLKHYKGFVKRTLTQSTDNPNQWTDIIEWNSLEDAHSAIAKAVDNPDLQAFFKLMKHGEKTYQTKSEYLRIQSQTNQ